MRRFQKSSGVALCLLLGLSLAACQQKSNQSPDPGPTVQAAAWPETPEPEIVAGQPGGTFRLGIVEPVAIDPFNSQESEGILVTKLLYTGLIGVEPDGTPIPGVAESWSANDDCSEWTFKLKPGTHFSNGDEVDAAAFKRGWDRAVVKSAASGVAYHMAPIQGYAEAQSGKADGLSGVDASAPDTLKVALTDKDCEFFLRTIHTVFSPVPEDAGKADNQKFNESPVGNGPFKMDGKWEHDKGIKLVRNDAYDAGPKAYLDAVEVSIVPNGNDDETDGYENGTFDWARMPTPRLTEERTKFEPQGQWITRNTNGINYLEPHLTEKPLDSVDARKAISMAIDRDAIIQGIFQGSQTAASTIVPPVFTDAYQKGLCDACTYNPEEAKKLAASAGLTPGTELNMQFNADAGHDEWMAAVKQQLETNLGLKVNMTSVPFADLIANRQAPHATGLFRAAWGADYPTPGNFLGPLLTTASIGATAEEAVVGDNKARYSNPQVDDLVNQAKASKDEAERTKLYQEAEKIAIQQDLALIPTWNRTQHRLANTAKFGNLRMDFNENPDLSIVFQKA